MTAEVLGIDVGGSSVKAGLVDVQRGTVQGALISAPTPRPCTPGSLMPVLVALAARLHDGAGPVGVAFPSVIKGGTAYTAANIDGSWIGTNGAALAAEALGRPVLMLNDADAGTEGQHDDGAGTALTAAEAHLGDAGGVRVVQHQHRPPERLGRQRSTVGADPAGIDIGRGVSRPALDDAWKGDADATGAVV